MYYFMYYRVMRASAPIVGALSGGFLYSMLNNVCEGRVESKSINNVYHVVNIGFFAGFGIGLSYAITGKPLMDNLLD
jgi:hypothetical protein